MSDSPLNISVWTNRRPWANAGVEFLIVNNPFPVNDGEIILGKRGIVKSLVFEEQTDGLILEPTFTLSNNSAQALFNELWQFGFRPSDGTGNSGHIQAMSHHLEDMRKLVFAGALRENCKP